MPVHKHLLGAKCSVTWVGEERQSLGAKGQGASVTSGEAGEGEVRCGWGGRGEAVGSQELITPGR